MAYYLIDLGEVEGLEMSSTYPSLNLSLTYNDETQNTVLTLQGEGYWADETGNTSIGIDYETNHATIYNNWDAPDVGHEYGVKLSFSELTESFTESTQKVIEQGIETYINSMTIEDDTNPTDVTLLFFDKDGYALKDGLFTYMVKGGGESAIFNGDTRVFAPASNNWNIHYENNAFTFTPSGISAPFTIELYKSSVCEIPASYGTIDDSAYYASTTHASEDGSPSIIYGVADILLGSSELYGEKGTTWQKASVGSIRLTQLAWHIVHITHYAVTIPANSWYHFQVDSNYKPYNRTAYQVLPIPWFERNGELIFFPAYNVNGITVSDIAIYNPSDSSITIPADGMDICVWAYGNGQTMKPSIDISELPYPD